MRFVCDDLQLQLIEFFLSKVSMLFSITQDLLWKRSVVYLLRYLSISFTLSQLTCSTTTLHPKRALDNLLFFFYEIRL